MKRNISGSYYQAIKIKGKRFHLDDQRPIQRNDSSKDSQKNLNSKRSMTRLLKNDLKITRSIESNTYGPRDHIYK